MVSLDLTLQSIGFRVLALLIIFTVHGATVAAAAVLLGDEGPRHDGRLSLLPTRHVEPIGAGAMILFGLGWPRTVAIDAREFGIGRAGILLVILAGFVSLLALAAVLQALLLPAATMLADSATFAAAAFLRIAGSLSIWVALLSLVPVPPLTAGLLLQSLGVRIPRQAEWILVALLLVAVATGVAERALGPAHLALVALVSGD